MTLRLTVACDGTRHGQACRASYSSALAFTPGEHWSADETLAATARRVPGGWRTLPNGGDLCPSGGHDEESEPWSSQGPVPPPPL